jgi:hypothetical protein
MVQYFVLRSKNLSLIVDNGVLRQVIIAERYLAHSHDAINVLVCITSVVKLQRSNNDLILGPTMSRIVMEFTNRNHETVLT